MSQLSFLVNPDTVGLTSCTNKPNVELMDVAELHDILHTLSDQRISDINNVVKQGKMFLAKGVNTRQGFNDFYHINDSWRLTIQRVSHDLYVFCLAPITIDAVSSFKNGLNKVAKRYITNNVDLDIWVRYDWATKIFYLQEFARVIADPKLIEAMNIYTTLYSRTDYLQWAEEYKWPLLNMSFTYRKYLKIHVTTHNNKIKNINKQHK